jgi:sugar lactone lactonase YvrE
LALDLGESPIWSVEQQQLYCIDIARRDLCRVDIVASTCEKYALPCRATAVVLTHDGVLLAAGTTLLEANLREGRVGRAIATEGGPGNAEVFNDAKCDAAGRLWIGTRHRDRVPGGGSLYRLDETGRFLRVADGFSVANGLAWSRRGNRMYVADSRRRLILRYAYDPAEGMIHDAAVFAELAGGDGSPDGLTVDEDDHVWCAIWDGASVRRYTPDGRLERIIQLPVRRPTSCIFGGADLRTLFVTTAREASTGHTGSPGTLAGSLFALEPGTAGLPGSAHRSPMRFIETALRGRSDA